MSKILDIKNLEVKVEGVDSPVINGLNLSINPGEVHAIMGPNGSGKSTLGYALSGRNGYDISNGEVSFYDKDLLDLDAQMRALEGLFLAFQYPVELAGVNNIYFLRAAYNSIRKHRGEKELDAMGFMKLVKEKMKLVDMDPKFLTRGVNEGFSGGEKKRNEILQMLVLEPKLCILDETDSGLDIDALKWVAKGVNALRSKDRSFVLVTHYQRLLDYIEPDYVHVLSKGKIVKSGGKELALMLEEQGYSWLSEEKV
jgi:Fe-S cluster assembly ATP-binding protein